MGRSELLHLTDHVSIHMVYQHCATLCAAEAEKEGVAPKLEPSLLSTLLATEQKNLVAAANRLWDMFAEDPATAEAAERMLVSARRRTDVKSQSQLCKPDAGRLGCQPDRLSTNL